MNRRVTTRIESWPNLTPFRIANYEWASLPSVVCEIEQDGVVGWGEALGVYYLNETDVSMLAQLESIRGQLEASASREDLQQMLPAGGARNAADAALWDLEAQLADTTVWRMAGVVPDPVETVFTIGLEPDPEQMAAGAIAASDATLFKVKLNRDRPIERMQAIRDARPQARLVVDVNQDWSFDELQRYAPKLHALGVQMIEQPLARGNDAELEGYESPVPLCADESCLHVDELEQAAQRYQMINIKLDKTGGLTHALELAHAVREKGLDIMVGSMCGSSLAMAPHHVVAQLADLADIDGPLLLQQDHAGGLVYENYFVTLPSQRFWGCR